MTSNEAVWQGAGHGRRAAPERLPVGRYRAAFYLVVVLIVYGSLYPFNFTAVWPGGAAAPAFADFWRLTTRRGDLLGNVVLFLPFGCFGMLGLLPARSRRARLAVLLLLGFVVAAGVQLLQVYLPTRTAAAVDVLWNLFGLGLGVAAVWSQPARRWALDLAGFGLAAVPAGLLACWLASELIPFVPSIDFQSFKDSLKPLLALPDLFSADFLGTLVSAATAAFLAERAWPGRLRLAGLLIGAAMLVFAKILIVQNSVSADFVAGLVCALALAPLVLRYENKVAPVLAGALAAYAAFAALEPFQLRAASEPFGWIPFAGSLNGSMMTNATAVCAKLFLWGALLYCLKVAGARLALATAATALFALMLEVAQVWVGSHTPEITDPLLVIVLGGALAWLSEHPVAAAAPGELPVPHSPEEARQPRESAPRRHSAPTADGPLDGSFRGVFSKRGLALAVTVCVVAALAMSVVLGLPQIPYNVRELFGGEDAWWRLFVFSLAGLSIGFGGALAGRLAEARERVFLVLPGAVLGACIVTYALLLLSVTEESLADIVGSANTYWFVTNRGLGGAPAQWLYEAVGVRWPIDMLERFVRFVALFGQPILWIAMLSAVWFTLWQRTPAGRPRSREAAAKAVACLFAAVPWLVVFNLIAFRYSSTDNLNELIAGHGHVLYCLLILLPLVALPVAHVLRFPRQKTALAAVVVWLLSLPVGWLLFKNGLSPSVEKYGQVFSGVDFLLGPDRTAHLPQGVLLLRWCLVQSAAIVGLAVGMQAVAAPPSRIER